MANPPPSDLEKNTGLATTSSLPVDNDLNAGQPHHHHHHHHLTNFHPRSRLRHFLHPSGKRIHIADSPHEAASLHRRLFDSSASAEPFQICISGSPEHLAAVRETQSHHQARQEELRGRHGDVWRIFEEVKDELDALGRELGRVTEKGVGVSLEGHFGRFGYDARIRSYDDHEEPGGGTTRSSATSSVRDDEGKAEALVLFKVPVVRQYFHKGILWRASTSEEVRSFELFVDLLYVGIIAINGDAAAESPTGEALLKFVITFTLSWKIWNDMAVIIAWFETDDVLQRFSILFLLACLFGFTTNIAEAFDHTYATLIGFYLTARLYMTAYLVLVACLVPMVRSPMLYYTLISLISTALWITSIQISYPNQLALIFLALFLDITGQASYITVLSLIGRLIPTLKTWATAALDFHPALNIEHRVERTNAFVSLVFGYTVVAILYQSAKPGIDAIFGKAILALIQLFGFNWLYFELDGANLSSHAIRRAKLTAMSWSVAHLPFIMAFVLGGGGLARLVLATDGKGASGEMLTEAYRERTEGEVAQGIRWFYCAGFGSALLFMCVISVSHVHRDLEGMRLGKRMRLSVRAAAAGVMICLPLAGERLDSLGLVATVTGLVVFTLAVEVWGVSRKGSGFVVGAGPCGYVGRCDRRNLRNVLEKGGEVDVDELGGKSGLKGSGIGSAAI